MTGICIDTSGRTLTMALWDERGIMASYSRPALQRHSELMAPELGGLLTRAGLSAGDLGVVAVVNGPGSFTGLRVGVSFAKGLAMGNRARLLPLSTLDAMACSITLESGTASPMLDARRKQVYAALYEMSPEGFRMVSGPAAIEPGVWLGNLPQGTAVFGSGLGAYRALAESLGGRITLLDGPPEPTAEGLVRLARMRFESGAFADIDELDACYVRKTDFETGGGRQ